VKNPWLLAQNLLFNICAEMIEFIRKITCSQDFIGRHRKKPSDFTRKRKLPPLALIAFLLSLVRGSYQKELDRFFNILNRTDVPKRVDSKIFHSGLLFLSCMVEAIIPDRSDRSGHSRSFFVTWAKWITASF